MPSRSSREQARIASRIRTLELEARAIKLWLEIYEEKRSTHEEDENTAYDLHRERYEQIVKEIHRLARPK
jgi:hypothetical protein